MDAWWGRLSSGNDAKANSSVYGVGSLLCKHICESHIFNLGNALGRVMILPEKRVSHGENGLCEPEQNSLKIEIFILSLCS